MSSANKMQLDKGRRAEEERKWKEELEKRSAEHKKWYEETKADVRTRIEWAVKSGHKSLMYNLLDLGYKDPLNNAMTFLDKFEYAVELRKIVKELNDLEYHTEIRHVTEHHDDSAAYMNSGGECGSLTPYSTEHMALVVSWGHY